MQLQALAKHFAADFAFVAVACGPKMLAGWLLDGRFAAGSELVLAFVEKLRRQKIDAQEGQLPLVSRPQAKLQDIAPRQCQKGLSYRSSHDLVRSAFVAHSELELAPHQCHEWPFQLPPSR